MSSQQDGNADTDILPLKWKPGTDHMSKLLLNDPNVMNLIVRSLVSEIAPENSYTVAPTEWADNSRSDVLYTPRAEVTKTMPPLLIVMQYLVDQDFMLRLIRYAYSTYDRYRVLPLILVIVTKGFSSTTFRREFTVSSNGFLLEASCLFWAKQCLLLSAESINGHLNQATLDPMVALGYLFTNHPSCQMPPQHQANSTLMMLYSVAREILSKEESTKSEKANLIYRLEKAKRDFETILDSDDSQGSNKNKVRQSAEDGIMLIEEMQKDLEGGGDSIEEDNNTIAKYTLEDAQFLESLTVPGENKNWKDIFNKGKAKGHFKSYKSSHSLKSSYYHIQRRKKQKTG